MEKKSSSHRNLIASSSIFLAAISFLADVIALGQVAYNIIVKNQTENLALQLAAIVLVFLLGFVLGSIGLRGFERASVEKVLQVYVWAYLVLACFSYLAVVRVFRSPYTFGAYFAYFVIIGIQLGAFLLLRHSSETKPVVEHALALLSVSVIHALIFLTQFIFFSVPDIGYVIGEWFFWLCWNLFAFPLIRLAFGSSAGSSFRARFQKTK